MPPARWLLPGPCLLLLVVPALEVLAEPMEVWFRKDGITGCFISQERSPDGEMKDIAVHRVHSEHCLQRRPFIEPLDNSSELEEVHVAYAAHRNHFDGLLGSMLSLARHLVYPRECVLHVIVRKEHMDAATKMRMCFLLQIEHIRHNIQVLLHEEMPPPFEASGRGNFRTSLSFARLYLNRYFPSLTRVLWLDTDTVLRADVSRLYRTRMRYTVAAAQEGRRSEFLRLATQIPGIPEHETLFQDGVLLIDLQRWKEEGVAERAEQLAKEYPWAGDQQIFNRIFQGRWHQLSWKWNLFLMCEGFRWPKHCLDNARLLHFTGRYKPWDPVSQQNKCFVHGDLYPRSLRCDYTADIGPRSTTS